MVKINVELTREDGSTLAIGSIVCPSINEPTPTPKDDGGGGYDPVYKRQYGLNLYVSQDDYLNGKKAISGGVTQFNSSWEKTVSIAEHAALMSDGGLSDEWLKDQLEGILGASTCEVVDPFA